MKLLIISSFRETKMWLSLCCTIMETGLHIFLNCTVKIRHDSSEHNETPFKIKPESLLVPFSEDATIPLKSRLIFFLKSNDHVIDLIKQTQTSLKQTQTSLPTFDSFLFQDVNFLESIYT